MEHIVRINGEKVYVSDGKGDLTEAPLSAVQYENPAEGDAVRIFEIDGGMLISRVSDVETDYMGTEDDVFSDDSNGEDDRSFSSGKKENYNSRESGSQGWSSGNGNANPSNSRPRKCNKHLYVWLFTFVLGDFGIDRFYRGQIGLGILKLITGGGLGFWFLADFIIALIKAYSNSAFGPDEDIVFIDGHYAK